MTQTEWAQYIRQTFDGVSVIEVSGTWFFFVDPQQKFPFATLVSDNAHDQASDLERPGVFRLNIGVGVERYRAMFGPPPPFPRDGGVVATGHDFSALDQIMPHPVYAAMGWVCVLNPDATLEAVKVLLAEAYKLDVAKHTKRRARPA